MKSTIARAGVVLSLCGAVAACGNSDAKIQELQQQADEKVKKAQDEASAKVAAAQKQIDTLKAQFEEATTKAKADADEAVRVAKESAEEQAKIAEKAANDAIVNARKAYQAEGRAKLSDINEDLKSLQIRTQKAPAKLKASANTALKDIQKKEQDIAKDIAAFEKASLETFRTTKAKLDQDLAKLKAQIKAAAAKLPP